MQRAVQVWGESNWRSHVESLKLITEVLTVALFVGTYCFIETTGIMNRKMAIFKATLNTPIHLTWCHKPEHYNLHTRHCQNLKSYKGNIF